MIPVSLSLTNFGPFKQTQTFRFPRGPGLFFLWGENQEEPRLEANGAGKSRLWEALVWVIFGKMSNGLKAGDVANWQVGKRTQVEFIYALDENEALELKVTRSWSPNTWTLTDWTGDELDLAKEGNALMADLRLEFTPFLNCVMMAQAQPMFLDLKPEAKAALFSEIMGLDQWLDYSQRASRAAAESDDECRALERQVSDLTGREDQLRSDDSLARLSREWGKNRADRLRTLSDDHAKGVARVNALKTRLNDSEAREAKARDDLKLTVTALGDLERLLERATTDETTARGLVVAADQRAQELQLKLADAEEFTEVCPLCLQDVDHLAHKKVIQAASDAASKAVADAEKVNAAFEAAHLKLKRLRTALAEQNSEIARLRDVVDEASQATRGTRNEIGRADADLDAIESEVEKLERSVDPHAVVMRERDDKLRAIAGQLRAARRRLEIAEERKLIQGIWVKGFKEIRLGLISEALEQLEIEVNSCVNALGLVGWELQFEVDRETAKGTLQRGFNVYVQSPHNDRPVPWEAWSGGEKQRLRVATQQGLSNLIRVRTGSTFNLEVWDEPTQWMSAQGVTDLLDSLALRARQERRQIWVVDHRTLGYGNFDGSSGVIKTRQGFSRFDQDSLYISGQESNSDALKSDSAAAGRRPRVRVLRSTPRKDP